jgi:hypothetical protein
MKKRTPRIAGAIVGTAVASLALASVGSASIQVKPANYDPGKLGTTVSKWAKGAGVPDGRGLEHGLKLSKGGVITDNAAGQAMVTDVRGPDAEQPRIHLQGLLRRRGAKVRCRADERSEVLGRLQLRDRDRELSGLDSCQLQRRELPPGQRL